MLSWDPGKTLLQSVHSQPELLIQAGWSHAFMLFTSYSDPTVRMSPQKSRLKRCFNAFLFCSSGETLKCSFRLAAATPSVDFCLKVQHVVHSQMLFCRLWLLFDLPLPFCQLEPIWALSSDP